MDRRILKQGLEKRNEKKHSYPKDLVNIVLYWNSKGLPRTKIPVMNERYYINPSKTFDTCIRSLKEIRAGRYYLTISGLEQSNRTITLEQMKKAIDRFHTSVTDLSVLPMHKDKIRKTAFEAFIFNRWIPESSPIVSRAPLLFFAFNDPKPTTARLKSVNLTDEEELYHEAFWDFLERAHHQTPDDFDEEQIVAIRYVAKNVCLIAGMKEHISPSQLNAVTPYDWVRWIDKLCEEIYGQATLDDLANRLLKFRIQDLMQSRGAWSLTGWQSN